MRYRSIWFPLFVIVLGSILLARNIFPELYWLRELHLFWPVLLILWGVSMLGRHFGLGSHYGLGRRSGWRQL